MKTYGTITWFKGAWVIEAEPHVVIRLRRVFPRISRKPDFVGIADTVETSRELEWFLSRFPLAYKASKDLPAAGVEGRLAERARLHRDGESLVDKLLKGIQPATNFRLSLPARDYQKLAASLVLQTGGLLIADDMGLGKAQPLDAKVHTPSGWVRMGDLRAGDSVSDPDGGTATVEGIFPQGERDVFRVVTADGSYTECCDEHLWTVYTPNDRARGTSRTLTLSIIRQKLAVNRGNGRINSEYFLPMSRPVVFATAENGLPIDPYLLGVLLGDGHLGKKAIRVSSTDDQLLERIASVMPSGITLRREGDSCDYRITGGNRGAQSNPLLDSLRELGLAGRHSWEKTIPSLYMMASVSERLELLRGLMDTDGTCGSDGAVTFTTTSLELAETARELVGSLGGFASVYSRRTNYTHLNELKEGRLSHTLNIRLPICPFNLTRKTARWRPPLMARAIKAIELVGRKPVQCILVSSKRHLYITDGFIVTHNTCTAICVLTDPRARPALVCTLTALPGQWESEVRKFAPNLTTHVLQGTRPYDITKRCGGKFPDVILTSYSKLDGWAETLAPALNSVTWDECLVADTNVALWPAGRLAIVDLKPGDRIASFTTDGKLEEDRVVGITPKGRRQVWRFKLHDGRHIDCTDNEKILTAAGWRYASEIINEARACYERIETNATDGNRVAADLRHDAGRRMSRHESHAPPALDEPWSQARGLRALQGKPASRLRSDATEVGTKRRLWGDDVHVSNCDNPGLRILALPLLPKRGRALAKDRNARVARAVDVGRLRFLVHGRWARATRKRWHQYAFVSTERGRASGGMVLCPGRRTDYRSSEDQTRKELLDAAVPIARGASACGVCQTVHSGLHELQGNLARDSNGCMQLLRREHGREESQTRLAGGSMQGACVSYRGSARSVPLAEAGISLATAPEAYRRVPSLPEICGAISNTLRTVQEPGAGEPTSSEKRCIPINSPTHSAELRLVSGAAATEEGWPDHAEADMFWQGLPDPSQAMDARQVLRLAPHHLLSIERRGVQEVWDVETEKNHTLVANGFAVHNCQELRRGDTTLKGAAAALIAKKVKFRTGLSGTPVYNMGGELHPVMEVIRPGALGTKTEFSQEWCAGDAENPGKIKIKDPKAMGTYLRDAGLMIRRTKQDVGREIPQLTRVPHQIDCDMKELNKIEGKAVALAQIIMSKSAQARGQQMQASSELNNLVRQATGISKAPYAAEFIRMVAASEERVIAYLWHRECYTILMEALSDKKLGDLHPVMYSGSESVKQKEEAKARFCGGDARVMLMSLRSGAGLDGLQNHCRIGVFAELDWSPGVHSQDEARIARDGQPFPTLFYYLLSNSGSDPIIADMLGIKRGQVEGILDPKGAFEHGLDADGQNVRKLAQAYLLRRAQMTPNGIKVVR